MRSSRNAYRMYPSPLIIILASNAILLVVAVTLTYVRYHDQAVVGKYKEVAGSRYPLDLPDMFLTVKDMEEYAIYGPQANAEWISTTPPASGYVHVGDEKRFLALAFAHELHCIRALRMAIAYPLHHHANAAHADHCLNYLRMYILCNPDLTLEKFDPLVANVTEEPERLGVTHVCRDWRPLYDELSRLKEESN